MKPLVQKESQELQPYITEIKFYYCLYGKSFIRIHISWNTSQPARKHSSYTFHSLQPEQLKTNNYYWNDIYSSSTSLSYHLSLCEESRNFYEHIWTRTQMEDLPWPTSAECRGLLQRKHKERRGQRNSETLSPCIPWNNSQPRDNPRQSRESKPGLLISSNDVTIELNKQKYYGTK